MLRNSLDPTPYEERVMMDAIVSGAFDGFGGSVLAAASLTNIRPLARPADPPLEETQQWTTIEDAAVWSGCDVLNTSVEPLPRSVATLHSLMELLGPAMYTPVLELPFLDSNEYRSDLTAGR